MMKKLILFFFFLLTLSVKAQTNIYHPFPDSNAVWNFSYAFYCFSSGTAIENYSVCISGDTSIKGKTFHKLMTPYIESFTTGSCPGNAVGYKGAIREDISIKMVFYIPPFDSIEHLLYDFNLQVGDSVKGWIESMFGTETIQEIDSVLIGNSFRKRWKINDCYRVYVIEGIGSIYGLVEQSPGCVTDLADYSLTCFMQNGKILYPDTNSFCELITISNQIIQTHLSVTLFPHPFHTTAILSINDLRFSNYELRIYDVMGKLVRQQTIVNHKSEIINREGLSDGLYFYELRTTSYELIGNGKMVVE